MLRRERAMFDLFGKGPGRPTLDSVTFDAAGYRPREASGPMRAWLTPEGDGFGLYFFAKPPDIPPSKDIDDLRRFYQAQVGKSGGTIVETSPLRLDGCPALKTLVKVPQTPSGLTFVASITIPFRDFSFVLKVQSEEHGVTGVREAVLLDRHLATGAVPEVSDGRMHVAGFEPDNESFDAEFPTHPLSRARRTIKHVAMTARLDTKLKKLPPFVGLPV
jgi:hypothetical protein